MADILLNDNEVANQISGVVYSGHPFWTHSCCPALPLFNHKEKNIFTTLA